MRTSTNTYSMRMPTSLEKHWSLEKRLKEWEFKDIDTWSPLKADQALPGPGETFNSRLHPALYRSSTSDENCVKLVKPVIAIAMRERADEHRYDYSQWSKDDPVNYSEPAQRSSSRRTTSDRGRSRGSPSISKRNARGWFSGLTSTSGKRDARS